MLLSTGCERATPYDNGVLKIIGRLGTRPGEFGYPRVITTDHNESVFVIDKLGRVQRFDPAGNLMTSWSMPLVKAGKPVGATVHPDGRLFVADTHYHRVLITDPDGRVLGSFGKEGTGEGEFTLPTDVAIDHEGNIYVSEYYETERISKWRPDLTFVQCFGTEPIDGRRLSRPAGMVIDEEQTLWVADACNHRLVRFSLDGQVLKTFGEFGSEPGRMKYPYDVNLAPDEQLLVCEYGGNRLQWFDKDGRSVRTWGEAGRGPGQLFAPWGAVYGPKGNIFVVDSRNNRVQIVRP
ncbi:MAG: 6-bladed beta-propeller [Planctomycetota bacterium]|jgi:DNA-binding beta-propeller fold protein YncE